MTEDEKTAMFGALCIIGVLILFFLLTALTRNPSAGMTQSPGAAPEPAALGLSAFLTSSDITDDAWNAFS